MQQCLALFAAAIEVAFAAVLFHLGDVTRDLSPALICRSSSGPRR
jgi:hypothetical protein